MGKNTQYNHWRTVKSRCDEINFRVIREKLTFEQYQELCKKLYDTNSFKRLTRENSANISGYMQGVFHVIQRILTEWRLFDKDGNLVLTGHSAEKLNYKFDYSVCKEREAKGLLFGHHTWIGTDGKKIWG